MTNCEHCRAGVEAAAFGDGVTERRSWQLRLRDVGDKTSSALAMFWFALSLLPVALTAAEPLPDPVLAERAVQVLTRRCLSCHGAEQAEGELRLDSRAALLKGGATGTSFDAARPSESLLLRAVKYAVPGMEMPPKDKLPAEEIAILERWLMTGAGWPEHNATVATDAVGDAWHDSRNPIVRLFGGQRLELWSLKPVSAVAPPEPSRPAWSRSEIDRFIDAKLDAAGLTPTPEADRRTLIRRLSFDLIGLPPTPNEVEAFLGDAAPDAYERLVDRLLASPNYGEHTARRWLDVVRYSDSNGFDWDEFRPAAWRFRDYVVRSLNADKSFAEFLAEQLAGDELLDGLPTTAAERDSLIATGYLRLGPQDNAAGLFNEQDRSRAEWLADVTETTGSAFLGLTLSCCRCHDHKFDPLSQADHYRLRAFFAALKYADDMPLDLAAEQQAIRAHNAGVDAETAKLTAQQDTVLAPVRARLRSERRSELSDDVRALLDRADGELSEADRARRNEQLAKTEPSTEDVVAALSDEQKSQHEAIAIQIVEAKRRKRSFTKGLLATDASGAAPAIHIFYQGNHQAPRDAVAPGFLSVLSPQPATLVASSNPLTQGRRLTLARWIASPDNPLTARVMVNRVWQALFGQGLVATPNDFGLAGTRPTHPELLDRLAADFVERGWSLKALHRRIVTSAAYRQASFRTDGSSTAQAVDAANQLYWRQNPRRLSAEQLRDAVLAIAGVLLESMGGPPVWPDLPPEVLQANPAFLDDNALKVKGWYPSPAAVQPLRSLYLIQKRTVRVPFLETFDLPENSASCPQRSTSTVAPQALSLLNNSLTIEAAQAFAARIQAEAGDAADRQIAVAFAAALQRAPTDDEQRACQAFLRTQSLAALCRALINLNEFMWID